VILLADPVHSPAADAASKPCPAQTSIGNSSADITVPDLVGQYAGGVEARLKSLGLNSVELSSANPDYKSVWVASNWTVVSTDPAPGCVVNRYERIVVYVTK
jgi:beta-lactam-binding protein with PASTA domain